MIMVGGVMNEDVLTRNIASYYLEQLNKVTK